MTPTHFDVVAIGASAGGVTAVQTILRGLSENFSTPIVIVQHISPDAKLMPDLVFGTRGGHALCEAEDKMKVEPRKIYFSTPGYHLLFESDRTLAVSQDDPVHFSRPSIDVFFQSVADSVGARAIGVLLTGANQDGAEGLFRMQKAGGYTMVQDPATAESPYMPRAALRIMNPDEIVSLDQVAGRLVRLCEEGRDG